jgi:hypothetical protein
LFGALVCQVPLLDMRRFHLLLAGASWMAEYGDPDNPDDWQFITEYSPYHNISADVRYPPVLITTSTRDDRVHPGHARKMTAALEAAGHRVWYYENIEGGHAGAADNAQIAFKSTLGFSFLNDALRNKALVKNPERESAAQSDSDAQSGFAQGSSSGTLGVPVDATNPYRSGQQQQAGGQPLSHEERRKQALADARSRERSREQARDQENDDQVLGLGG